MIFLAFAFKVTKVSPMLIGMIPLNSEEITLCSDSVDGGSICLWYLYVFSMHWYFLIFSHWTVKRSLCAMTVLTGGGPSAFGIYMCSLCTGISLYFLIEQWRDHSVLWQCWLGGPSAFGIYMFSLCTGIPYIFSLNSEAITLCSDSVARGVHLPLVSQWYHWTVKRSLCAMTVVNRGVHLPLVSICFLYALVFPYIFWLNSEEITLCYDGVEQGGFHLPLVSPWHHWTVKRSLCALTVVNRGVHLPLVSICFLYALVFPYIFLLFDCFEWALIGNIAKCRVYLTLQQFWLGVHLPLVSTCFLYALVFPYISLLVDLFKWALIRNIEKCRVHSVLWQFWICFVRTKCLKADAE